jgi:acylphosphatase
MKQVRTIVSGRVQGVWFRARTRDKAVALGVTGFVRNLPDGTVEIVAQGEESQIDALMSWARQGPPMAEVSGLKVDEIPNDADYSSFEVRY